MKKKLFREIYLVEDTIFTEAYVAYLVFADWGDPMIKKFLFESLSLSLSLWNF